MRCSLVTSLVASASLVVAACTQDQTKTEGPNAFKQAVASIKSASPGEEIKTTDLNISRTEIENYIENAVIKRPVKTFVKWSPKKGEYIYYAVSGLDVEKRLIFATIVAEFAARTKLPVRPHEKNSRINILFNYLNDMSEIRETPDLRKIYCPPLAQNCPNAKSPNLRRKAYGKAPWSEGDTALLTYLFATKLDPTVSGNELAAIFVKDVLHAFIGDTHMSDIAQESVVSLRSKPIVADGPVYSWRVPVIDLLFLRAIYDPSVATGITLPEAADLITARMADALVTPLKLVPRSTLIPGKGNQSG